MKDKILLILTLLFYLSSFGQEKETVIPRYKNGDEDLSYLLTQKRAKELKITDLTKSNKILQVRLWTEGQVIDIWLNSDSSIVGQIITYTMEVDEYGDRKKKSKIYTQKNKLKEISVSSIFADLDSLNILGLKSVDSISNWQRGTDGYSYLIEYTTRTKYCFKDYWGCSYQDSSIIEAISLETFFNKLKNDLDLKNVQDKFMNDLPDGCYNNGSMIVFCKDNSRARKNNR